MFPACISPPSASGPERRQSTPAPERYHTATFNSYPYLNLPRRAAHNWSVPGGGVGAAPALAAARARSGAMAFKARTSPSV